MSVAGNDLARVQGRPDVFFNSVIRWLLANLTDHLLQPEEHFLVSQTKEQSLSVAEL